MTKVDVRPPLSNLWQHDDHTVFIYEGEVLKIKQIYDKDFMALTTFDNLTEIKCIMPIESVDWEEYYQEWRRMSEHYFGISLKPL